MQLTFLVIGTDRLDFLKRYRQLVSEIEKGLIELKVIPLQTIYKLTMESPMSLDVFGNDNSGMLVVKFNEPNPKDEKSTLRTVYVLSSNGFALASNKRILTENIE